MHQWAHLEKEPGVFTHIRIPHIGLLYSLSYMGVAYHCLVRQLHMMNHLPEYSSMVLKMLVNAYWILSSLSISLYKPYAQLESSPSLYKIPIA